MNAKEEFLKKTEGLEVRCAEIIFNEDDDDIREKIYLPLNYTEDDYMEFLERINQEYDDGYGGQELFGIIWLKNGEWLERYEYDGSECWHLKKTPKIPDYLQSKEEFIKQKNAITTDLLELACRIVGISIDFKTTDILIGIIKLIETKGGDVNLRDLTELQNEIK